MRPIYLDHNSTTPLLPAVAEAMGPYWTATFGNPASAHSVGRRARQALEAAREQVAALLGAEPAEVVFTSGATEANNLAVYGSAPTRIITSPIEHPSVAEPVAELKRRGLPVEPLAVDATGVVRVESLRELLRTPPVNTGGSPGTQLLTVMLANNETGAVQPIAELAHAWQEIVRGSAFHCDAVQAVGKIPVHFHALGVTTLSLSAHKFNGPRGIGALFLRRATRLRPLFQGGHQQEGHRPGTEPVALVIGLAKALELACQEMDDRTATVRRLRARFLTRLREPAAPVVLNGPETGGLPHTVNLSFPGCEAAVLLMKLDLAGVACSTGSACSSGSLLPSPVLQAMACPPEVLHSAMRFSLSHLTSAAEIDTAVEHIALAVRELRNLE